MSTKSEPKKGLDRCIPVAIPVDMSSQGPAELIAASGKTQLQLAAESGTSLGTIQKAKKTDAWPRQCRVRAALARALGLDQPATVTHQPENLMAPELPARRG